jgi:aldehyde dehydrogenase (NAD+)
MPETEVRSVDPWTGEPVFAAPAAGAAETAATVGRAAAAAPAWAATPTEERAAALRRFADAVDAEADALAGLIVREVGKRRVDAEGEVAWTAASARWYAAHPPAPERAGGALVIPRPVGVVAAVTPWNVPLITPAWKWLPALVAGDVVVWKPSERATATALAALERLRAAGVPDDVVQVLPGGPATARALCGDARVDALHFTGGEAGGRALAAMVPRAALELSGLNPAVVLADADLDLAADCITACATALAGQKCTATRRVLVDREVAGPLRDKLGERFERLRVGDPGDPATDVGPLIGPEARAAAEARVAAARRAGARVEAAAAAPGHGAAFPPTLLSGLAAGDSLRTEELFAPVVALEPFATPAEAWAAADASSYGLSAALYGHDPATLAEGVTRLRAGVVAVNRRGDDVALEAPFGGRKRSGNGHPEGGRYVYGGLCDLQAVYGFGSGPEETPRAVRHSGRTNHSTTITDSTAPA